MKMKSWSQMSPAGKATRTGVGLALLAIIAGFAGAFDPTAGVVANVATQSAGEKLCHNAYRDAPLASVASTDPQCATILYQYRTRICGWGPGGPNRLPGSGGLSAGIASATGLPRECSVDTTTTSEI